MPTNAAGSNGGYLGARIVRLDENEFYCVPRAFIYYYLLLLLLHRKLPTVLPHQLLHERFHPPYHSHPSIHHYYYILEQYLYGLYSVDQDELPRTKCSGSIQ